MTNKTQSEIAKAKDAAASAAEEAGSELRAGAEKLKEKGAAAFEEAKHQARDLAHEAADTVKDRAYAYAAMGKDRGAEQIHAVSDAIRGAADKLQEQAPFAARYVREAAAGIDSMSKALRQRNVDDIIGGVDEFGRRNPAAIFGGAVLAGFFLARFVKSSADRRDTSRGPQTGGRQAGAMGQQGMGQYVPRPAPRGGPVRYGQQSSEQGSQARPSQSPTGPKVQGEAGAGRADKQASGPGGNGRSSAERR